MRRRSVPWRDREWRWMCYPITRLQHLMRSRDWRLVLIMIYLYYQMYLFQVWFVQNRANLSGMLYKDLIHNWSKISVVATGSFFMLCCSVSWSECWLYKFWLYLECLSDLLCLSNVWYCNTMPQWFLHFYTDHYSVQFGTQKIPIAALLD